MAYDLEVGIEIRLHRDVPDIHPKAVLQHFVELAKSIRC